MTRDGKNSNPMDFGRVVFESSKTEEENEDINDRVVVG